MRKSGFTTDRMIGFIKQVETEMPVADLCREHGFSGATFYNWRASCDVMQRRHAASALPRIDPETWATVEARLREDWSPEQIAGAEEVAVSIERIYQHIASNRQHRGTVWQHLRRRKRRRRHRCGTPRERQRFGGQRIYERPVIVEQRGRVGDFEGDTIVGKGPARIVIPVDRKSAGCGCARSASAPPPRSLRPFSASCTQCEHVCKHLLGTMAGSSLSIAYIGLGTNSYFAMPYSSWQRGCNENLNGLVRQYIPKGCDIGGFTDEQIQQIEDKLNRRSRTRFEPHRVPAETPPIEMVGA